MRHNTSRGFMLVELLSYLAGMVIILSAISYFIVQMYTAYGAFIAPARVDRIGMSLAAELAKEIRSGTTIDQSTSAFGTPNGFITIQAQSGSTTLTKYFGLQSSRMIYKENAGAAEFLTPENISVSALRFTQITTPVSYAVRYEISITYTARDGSHTRTYTGLATLRHSYE